MKIENLSSLPTPRDAAHPFLVTDMKPAQKDPNRVNIFVNGTYSFSLEISQVVDYSVKVGKPLSLEDLETLKSASEFGKLYTATLEWILARPRSVRETRDHLKDRQIRRRMDNTRRAQAKVYKSEHRDENPYKNPDNLDSRGRLKFKNSPWAIKTDSLPEISDDNIEKVISRLLEKGFLDDAKFAKFYIENRFVKKGISRTRLESELMKKGVDRRIISEAFNDTPRDESEEIRKVIAKKSSRYPRSKMRDYLLRQGFSYSAVNSAIDEAYSED